MLNPGIPDKAVGGRSTLSCITIGRKSRVYSGSSVEFTEKLIYGDLRKKDGK
jgi:hypothetical protein